MRKVLCEAHYINYSLHKAQRALKRKKKKRRINNKHLANYNKYLQNKDRRRRTVVAPSYFSLVNNTDETLLFFKTLCMYIESGKNIYVDLEQVEDFTPDSLLYIIAIFDHYRQKNFHYKVSGNTPTATTCKQIFIESGFFEYVKSKNQLYTPKNLNILKIEKHSLVEGPLAKNIIKFCMNNLGSDGDRISSSLYRIIVELMGNTREHAYISDRNKLRWYIMAIYDDINKVIKITFLDAGVGIPTTIRRNFHELIRDKLSLIPGFENKQNILIRSALEGKFRTRTEKKFRGKGLPSIYKCYNNNNIKNLIISDRAYLNLDSHIGFDLNIKLMGTLYYWEIS